MLVLMPSVVLLGAAPAAAQVADNSKTAAVIERACGLKKGTITVSGDEIRLQPSPDEAYENVDCALERLKKAGLGKLGFVGNEADPNAVLRPPLRYIAVGSNFQIAALIGALETDKWTIVRRGSASDGTLFVQFESGPMMTHGEAGKIVERIWGKEFGDIWFGYAPTKLSEPEPLGG